MIASVVVPTYNRCHGLHRVLTALVDQTVPRDDYEIIVVSDGSTDGTDEYLAGDRLPPGVIPLVQANGGPGVARNTGVERATGELVIFVDDDVVAEPDLVERHVDAHRSTGGDGRLAVMGPMLLPADHRASAWIGWEQEKIEDQYAAMERGDWEPTFRQFFTGNASIPRALLQEVGGFDARYRRAEDVELSYRLDEAGCRFVFEPRAIGWHYASRSYSSWLENARAYGANDVLFGRDHGRTELLEIIRHEFPSRHAAIRAMVRAAVRLPRLGSVLQSVVGASARGAAAARLGRPASALLSIAYNLRYYRAVAAELGGAVAFRDTILRAAGSSVLVTVSGTIEPDVREQSAAGLRPRPDYVVFGDMLGATLLDHSAARARAGVVARLIDRVAGGHVLLAWTCFRERGRYDVIVTDGEQVGLPLAALLRCRGRGRPAHVMIAHIMSVPMKRLVFRALGLRRRIDAMLVYSSWQERFAVEELAMPADRVVRSVFMVDTAFFSPDRAAPDGGGGPLVATAGLERRDYATLVEAVRDLDVRVVIAAASNWSTRTSSLSGRSIPSHVEVCSLAFEPLRDLYADADVVVMPLLDVEFQAGVTTILEAMAMAKPVVCTRTHGQTDVVVDGVNGLYVRPGDAAELRVAIERLLGDPELARRLGDEARRFAVERADVEVYAREIVRLVDSVRTLSRVRARAE